GERLRLALVAEIDSDAEEVRKASISGTISLDGQALVPTGGQTPFLSASPVSAGSKGADLLDPAPAVGSVALEGLEPRVWRGAGGAVDVVEIFKPRVPAATAGPRAAAAGAPSGPAPPPDRHRIFPILVALAQGFERIRVEHITLAPSAATFVDE